MCHLYVFYIWLYTKHSTKVMSPDLESCRFFSDMAVGVIEIAKYLNSNDDGGGGVNSIEMRLLLAQTYVVVKHELNIIDQVLTC